MHVDIVTDRNIAIGPLNVPRKFLKCCLISCQMSFCQLFGVQRTKASVNQVSVPPLLIDKCIALVFFKRRRRFPLHFKYRKPMSRGH